MAKLVFTANLQRHVACPPTVASGTTAREVLESAFRNNPTLRGYVLDDQGHLRKHMIVFINSTIIADREGLSDAVSDSDEVYVMQALSGGAEPA